MEFVITEKLELRKTVTPRPLREKPIHRWFVFPHSFTDELVSFLINKWGLNSSHKIFDPFVGAGTTLVTAKENNIPAIGLDLSPLAVFVSNAKVSDYNLNKLIAHRKWLENNIRNYNCQIYHNNTPSLIKKAFPEKVLDQLLFLKSIINETPYPESYIFLIALLRILQNYSYAIPSGGWLKWVEKEINPNQLFIDYLKSLNLLIQDYEQYGKPNNGKWKAIKGDSRRITLNNKFDAVITSPPYPNRHDYTRVFNVELLFAFLDEEEVKKLRYQSLTSHVESKPFKRWINTQLPKAFHNYIKQLKSIEHDERIPPMLTNYFLDLKQTLLELKKILKPGAKLAFILGNARYSGLTLLVDEIFAEIAEMVGFKVEEIIAIRYRGNSAQQMKKYGKISSRESLILLKIINVF